LTLEAVQVQRQEQKPELTFLDRLSAFSYRIFGKAARRMARSFPSLRDEIQKSNLRLTPEAMLSVTLLATVISVAAAAAMIVIAFVTHLLFLALAFVAPPIVFLLSFNAPKLSQSSRSYALDNELPFVIGYMNVLAGGGVSPISTLKRISQMSKLFPAAAREAKRILVDVEVFGIDPITALEKAAKFNPNRNFAEFLYGYTTVLKTGGDFVNYLSIKLKEIFDQRESKVKRSSETIGTLAEAYMTVTALLGITLFVLYEVEAILTHSSGGIQSLFVYAFVAVPLLSVIFLWILDGTQIKQPYVDMRPYKAFAISAPIGGVLFLLPLPLTLTLHVSLALATMVAAPSVLSIRYGRERRGMEKALPDFIRDMAEGRKIGLPPESTLEQLASKNYGRLSKHVRKMGSQISWGVALRKVVNTFTTEVHSWITRAVGTLMMEVIDVGGGTVKSFSDMADFTRKVNDLEDEKTSMLRPYIFVIYMSGIMVVVTTFLMAYLLVQASSIGPAGFTAFPALDKNTVDLLFVSAVFQGWVVGFVAGKMGEGSVASGFKHSLILVVVSIATIYLGSIFIKLPV
jgi:flagellar protein FlaJ